MSSSHIIFSCYPPMSSSHVIFSPIFSLIYYHKFFFSKIFIINLKKLLLTLILLFFVCLKQLRQFYCITKTHNFELIKKEQRESNFLVVQKKKFIWIMQSSHILYISYVFSHLLIDSIVKCLSLIKLIGNSVTYTLIKLINLTNNWIRVYLSALW